MKTLKKDFSSRGIRCDGDLHLPDGIEKPPVVIMAHGMAALKNFGLSSYAERFIEKGLAVFLFDYRSFGKSDGQPRHIVNPFDHISDWRAAIKHVKNLKEVDGTRTALWGSSFSGAHVIACASEDHDIRAVVAQVPFVSGFSSISSKSISEIIKASFYGMIDALKSMLGLDPHYSPAVGYPGSFAALNTDECMPGYLSLVPEKTPEWDNKMASRLFLLLPLYSVVKKASMVKAPTLVMAGKHDSLIPIEAVQNMASKLPHGELVVEDCNHFEPYTGDFFERFITKQSEFLERHLKTTPPNRLCSS